MDAAGRKSLAKSFSNRSRKAAVIAGRLMVPRVMGDDGALLSTDQIGKFKYVWDWSLREGRFLAAFRETAWDFDQAVAATAENPAWARKLIGRKDVQAYQAEETHRANLARIPTPDWVKSEYMAGVVGEVVHTDHQLHCLDRLKEIIIPRNTPGITINNVVAMPNLPAGLEAAIRAAGDVLADQTDLPQAANG